MADVPADPTDSEPGEATPPDAPAPGENCWFCRSAPAEAGCVAQTPLYSDVRIADVQTTFNGYNIKKTWRLLNVPVPRCRRCAAAHATRAKLLGGFTVFPVLAVIVAAVCSWSALDGFIGVMVVSIIGGLVAAGVGRLVGYILGRLFTPSRISDEGRGQDHPDVQALLAQGWKVGRQPQPGEEFKGR